MTKQEQDALLEYLEFTLTTMVEQNEIAIRQKFGFDAFTIDALVGLMYDNSYEVLNEMERSYGEVNDMTSKTPISKTK